MEKKREQTMLEVIEPDYMTEFSCNGLRCPDTCCKGWDIVIDEATCERYQKSNNTEFKTMLSRAIVHRNERTRKGEEDIACIRMGKGNRCLFLCNDGLCMIQRRTDEKNLSETCRTYPRVLYIWNEEFVERSLCVSCPEAVHLILERKEPLRFVRRKIAAAELDGLRITDKGQRLKVNCLPLRRFLIHVLQDRKLSLTRRLQIANEFFWQAGGMCGHHAERKFEHIMDDYQGLLHTEELTPVLTGNVVPCNDVVEQQLGSIRDLFFQRLQNPALRTDFRQQLEEVLAHWELKSRALIPRKGVEQYIEDRELYQLFLLPKYSALLETYLVNEVFKDMFITETDPAFYLGWFRLLVQFVIVRALLLTTLSESGTELTQNQIIEEIQQTSRVIGHDELYLEQAARQQFAVGQSEEMALRHFCDSLLQPIWVRQEPA